MWRVTSLPTSLEMEDMKRMGLDLTLESCSTPSHGNVMAVGKKQKTRKAMRKSRIRLEVAISIKLPLDGCLA